MWNPTGPTRNAAALSMAAAIAFLGCAVLLSAGRTVPRMTGGATAAGPPGVLLFAIAILLGAGGVLLVALAGRELLGRRRPPVR